MQTESKTLGSSFASFRVYSKSSKGKYEIDIELPFNIFNLKEDLARSIFITLYKPYDCFVYVGLNQEGYSSLKEHREVFDVIADCQTIFNKYTKDIPFGIYNVGQTVVVITTKNYIGKSDYYSIDDLYYPEQTKAIWKERLKKAAIIVEGMLQYKFHGKFTDDCLALVDEYRATKMLEG